MHELEEACLFTLADKLFIARPIQQLLRMCDVGAVGELNARNSKFRLVRAQRCKDNQHLTSAHDASHDLANVFETLCAVTRGDLGTHFFAWIHQNVRMLLVTPLIERRIKVNRMAIHCQTLFLAVMDSLIADVREIPRRVITDENTRRIKQFDEVGYEIIQLPIRDLAELRVLLPAEPFLQKLGDIFVHAYTSVDVGPQAIVTTLIFYTIVRKRTGHNHRLTTTSSVSKHFLVELPCEVGDSCAIVKQFCVSLQVSGSDHRQQPDTWFQCIDGMDGAGRHDDSVPRCQDMMYAIQGNVDTPLQRRHHCIEWSRVLTQLLPLVKRKQCDGPRWPLDEYLADNRPRLDRDEVGQSCLLAVKLVQGHRTPPVEYHQCILVWRESTVVRATPGELHWCFLRPKDDGRQHRLVQGDGVMKRKMLAIIVIVVVLAVAATAVTLVLTRAAQGNKVTGDTFETTVGKTFTVPLDANMSTGYNWTQTTKDTNVVAYVDIAYVATASSTQVVGGSGTVTFTFKAIGKGTTTISFAYARPWESVPPSQTRTITVTVK